MKYTFRVIEGRMPNGKPFKEGVFSDNFTAQKSADALLKDIDSGRIELEDALKIAINLHEDFDNFETSILLGSLFRKSFMSFESDDVYEEAYKRAIKFIPKGFRGQIKWVYPGNRPFLRIAHGYLLTLMAARDERKARALAKKLLRWSPEDELGVRLLVNDINLISGDYVSTLPNYLALTGEAPVNWYRAALCALRVSNYVDACTYLRKGIAGNVYVAEELTGRFPLDEHVSGNNSDLNGPRAASEYLASPTNLWTYEEIDFVDWVFNSSDVLRERADLMAISEALVFENDTATRADWGARADAFVKGIDDRVSRKMVRKVTTRAGKEVWPWVRARRYPFGEKAPVS